MNLLAQGEFAGWRSYDDLKKNEIEKLVNISGLDLKSTRKAYRYFAKILLEYFARDAAQEIVRFDVTKADYQKPYIDRTIRLSSKLLDSLDSLSTISRDGLQLRLSTLKRSVPFLGVLRLTADTLTIEMLTAILGAIASADGNGGKPGRPRTSKRIKRVAIRMTAAWIRYGGSTKTSHKPIGLHGFASEVIRLNPLSYEVTYSSTLDDDQGKPAPAPITRQLAAIDQSLRDQLKKALKRAKQRIGAETPKT